MNSSIISERANSVKWKHLTPLTTLHDERRSTESNPLKVRSLSAKLLCRFHFLSSFLSPVQNNVDNKHYQ